MHKASQSKTKGCQIFRWSLMVMLVLLLIVNLSSFIPKAYALLQFGIIPEHKDYFIRRILFDGFYLFCLAVVTFLFFKFAFQNKR